MGYVSRDIAVITEPKQLTLASLPNFVQFASKPKVQTFYEFNIQVVAVQTTPDLVNVTELQITEPSGVEHVFHGSTNPIEVGGSVFYVSTDPANTAENLRQSLLANPWISANYDIRIPFTWIGVTPVNGRVLSIKSKGAGSDYNIVIAAPNNGANAAYILTPINTNSQNGDSISGQATIAEIEIDVYVDPDIFLGQDDRPTTNAQIGTYAISLQKTYAGAPLWFELNSIFQHFAMHNVPPDAPGWFNTGTIRAYRFVAKKMALDSFAFYQSSALFVLNGYGRASDPINMLDYTYGYGSLKLLTNRPRTTYIPGQKEIINFIFSDPERGQPDIPNFSISVAYNAYSTGEVYLGTVYGQTRLRSQLNVVNSCVLDMAPVLAAYPTAGVIRVGLVRDTAVLSNTVEYEVLPECLHKLTQFIFLNRLGGWDVFNFDSLPTEEIKPEVETFNRTLTPAHTKSTGIETVYTANLDENITVDGAPVNADVAEWLKELAASRVVLDGEGNYVVIDDLKTRENENADGMYIPQIKYHISETYTND